MSQYDGAGEFRTDQSKRMDEQGGAETGFRRWTLADLRKAPSYKEREVV